MDAAVATHRAGRLDEAAAIYARLLADPQQKVRAALNLGGIFLGRKAFAQAESLFAGVLAGQPDHPQAWDSRINALIGGGRFEEAERAASRRGDPVGVAGEVRLRQHWAAALSGQRQFAAAEVQLRRVCDLAGDADSHNDLGRLLLTARRPAEALQALDAGLAIDPLHLASLINQGSAYRLQERFADAEAAYRRALAIDSTNDSAVRNLGALLKAQGRADEARAVEDAAQALGADLGGSDLAHGATLFTSGNYDAALAVFELAAGAAGRLEPGHRPRPRRHPRGLAHVPPPPVLDVFIGFDRQEVVAYHVLCQSILERASVPVRFTPVNLTSLGGVFDREALAQQSTEFSFSRFLTPYLSGYAGWSLFMDCDMLARGDFAELFALADDRFAVMVCKHDYVPKDQVKFLNHAQAQYPGSAPGSGRC